MLISLHVVIVCYRTLGYTHRFRFIDLQRVYTFIKGASDGGKDMKALLGGKGANLCEMARFGLNVPGGE